MSGREEREEFEKCNPVPIDAKWDDRKQGYYWVQHPGVTHPFDNDWMIWQEACEWKEHHDRKVDEGPIGAIEQRLREAHPISHQRASGSNILLEAADEIAHLQSEVERLNERINELSESCINLSSGLIRAAYSEPAMKAWRLRKDAEILEGCAHDLQLLPEHLSFSAAEMDGLKCAIQHCIGEAKILRQKASELDP